VPHPDLDLEIPPVVTASVLLAARQFALASGISWPGIENILAATGASPEEAHAIEDTLLDQLVALAVMAKQQTPPLDLAGLDHGAEGPAVPHPDLDLEIPPVVTASVLLAARRVALASGISWPGIEDILATTGAASLEEAHAIEDALLDQLAGLAVMANRQTPAPNVAGLDHGAAPLGLAVEMIRFIARNPGCAQVSGTRERYTDGFRQFVLDLGWRYPDVTTAEFAAAIDLPLDTVEDWLRGGRRDVDTTARAKVQRVRRDVRLA
jgi:hypothetical protein